MFIKRISINKNCSSFANGEKLELCPDNINVIYGPNGSGKTSLSKIFNVLSDNIEIDEKKDILSSLKTLTATEPYMEIACTFNDDNIVYLQPQTYGLKICVFNSEYVNSKIQKVEFTDNSFEVKRGIETGSKISNPLEDEYNLRRKDFEEAVEKLKQFQENVLIPQEESIEREVTYFKSKVNSKQKTENIIYNARELISNNILKEPIKEEDLINEYNLYKNSDNDDKLPDFIQVEHVKKLLEYKDKITQYLKYDEDLTKLEYAKTIVESSSEEKQRWILQGIALISSTRCPFCGKPIDEDTKIMIQSYKQYTESKYNETRENLLSLKEEIKNHCSLYKDFSQLILKAKYISTLINDEIKCSLSHFLTAFCAN